MIVISIRSKEKESLLRWEGKPIWFSPNLIVQQVLYEDGKIVIEVNSNHNSIHQEDGSWVIIVEGEDLNKLQKPQRLPSFIGRLKIRP